MRQITFIIISLLFSLNLTGQDFTPTRDVEATDDGIIVTYHFNGGQQQDDPLHPGAKFWKIPGFALNDVAGQPAFPFHWDTFAVPDDCEVLLTLMDSTFTDMPFTMAPAYPPLWDSDTIGYNRGNVPDISSYTGLMPRSAVLKSAIQYYRGQGLVRVASMPVQYNMQQHTLRTFSMLRYRVSFTQNGAMVRGRDYVSARNDRRVSMSDPFLENVTLNYSLSQNGRKNIRQRTRSQGSSTPNAVPDNRDYLIISTPAFAEAANKLAEWKRTKGFRTHVVLQNGWTVWNVHETIINKYYTNGVNLYYIMIIGDSIDVPAYANNNYLKKHHLTDYYYGYTEAIFDIDDSNQVIPSVRRGRLPVHLHSEAMDIVDKIIAYEKEPPIDATFYNKGLHCAYFQDDEYKKVNNNNDTIVIPKDSIEDRRFVLTSEEIKNAVGLQNKYVNRVYFAKPDVTPLRWNNTKYASGDSIPLELRRPAFPWNGSSSDIIDQINNKKFYILYRGHGGIDRWKTINFTYDSIDSISNGVFQPVVFSVTCNTGTYTNDSCFAKKILKKNTGGCVSIIAADQISLSGYNDSFAEGMFNAIWPDTNLSYHFPHSESYGSLTNDFEIPLYDMGSVMDYGLLFMADSGIINSDSESLYTREVFHLFGDPAMMIYTEQPVAINNPSIYVKGDTIKVRTTDGDARISFHTLGSSPTVDSYLGNSVDYFSTADSVTICIDRHNCIPYIATYHRNEYIQNETISDNRTYIGKTIKAGRSVTTTKPVGDVIINGANLVIQGGNVELHPGTTIINSNVEINPHAIDSGQ